VRRLASGWASVQERAERTLFGRGVISGLVVLILLIGVVANLPASPIRTKARGLVGTLGAMTGLSQGWGVFAPDPPRQSEDSRVVVTLTDGSEIVWRVPRGDPVITHYGAERWRILVDKLPGDNRLCRDLARWVARTVPPSGEHAARVRIVRTVSTIPPPGTREQPRVRTTVLYDERL
jgi:hypothetical protein